VSIFSLWLFAGGQKIIIIIIIISKQHTDACNVECALGFIAADAIMFSAVVVYPPFVLVPLNVSADTIGRTDDTTQRN